MVHKAVAAGEQLTTNHKTTVLCMDTGFRIWMAYLGTDLHGAERSKTMTGAPTDSHGCGRVAAGPTGWAATSISGPPQRPFLNLKLYLGEPQ
jgi:hypothetical protein